MGIFDTIEIRQHVRSIGELVFYFSDVLSQKENYPKELDSIANFIRDHLKNIAQVLDKCEK